MKNSDNTIKALITKIIMLGLFVNGISLFAANSFGDDPKNLFLSRYNGLYRCFDTTSKPRCFLPTSKEIKRIIKDYLAGEKERLLALKEVENIYKQIEVSFQVQAKAVEDEIGQNQFSKLYYDLSNNVMNALMKEIKENQRYDFESMEINNLKDLEKAVLNDFQYVTYLKKIKEIVNSDMSSMEKERAFFLLLHDKYGSLDKNFRETVNLISFLKNFVTNTLNKTWLIFPKTSLANYVNQVNCEDLNEISDNINFSMIVSPYFDYGFDAINDMELIKKILTSGPNNTPVNIVCKKVWNASNDLPILNKEDNSLTLYYSFHTSWESGGTYIKPYKWAWVISSSEMNGLIRELVK